MHPSHSRIRSLVIALIFIVLFSIYTITHITIVQKGLTNSTNDNEFYQENKVLTSTAINEEEVIVEEEKIEEKHQQLHQQPQQKETVNDNKGKQAEQVISRNVCKEESVLRNVDPNHTQAHLSFWQRLDPDTINVYKKKWQQFISSAPAYPGFSKGRGIVLVAGNRDTFDRALTTCRFLREQYQSNIDIEIWHLSDEHPTADMKTNLKKLKGVFIRDLSDPSLPRPITSRSDAEKQFQIKAAAIINSDFSEVLYLDSDNVPTQDPSFLFDTKEYKRTGALFWPDFWKTHGENKIFDILDIPCNNEWEQESGQMVLDKKKSWFPLQLAWYMQKNYEIYFQFLNGDKDTFKYAWQALNVPYHMTPAFLGMAGTIEFDRFCGHTMIQYYTDDMDTDTILFVHANLMKISDKRHYLIDTDSTIERPWRFIKRSTMSHQNTWIKPQFYISMKGQACMDFNQDSGEPESVTENFDMVLPGFQETYFELGGIGGETRV